MKIQINKKFLIQITKYIIISAFGYGFVFSSLYFCVQILKLDKTYSFMISYGIWYMFLYLVQLKLLFNTNHEKKKFIKFCIFLISFYLIANVLYNLGIHLKLNYLMSTLITVVILMPFRFFISKFYVFK